MGIDFKTTRPRHQPLLVGRQQRRVKRTRPDGGIKKAHPLAWGQQIKTECQHITRQWGRRCKLAELVAHRLRFMTVQCRLQSAAALFHGIKAAVAAIVLHAMWRLGGKTLTTPLAWALADCFLLPAYYGCLNARRRQAARVRKELPTE